MKKMMKVSAYVQEKKEKVVTRIRHILCENNGDGFADVAIKILIGVVIGGLLLTALYKLWGDQLIPKISDTIMSMFDYKG